jgi:hypothetical protein
MRSGPASTNSRSAQPFAVRSHLQFVRAAAHLDVATLSLSWNWSLFHSWVVQCHLLFSEVGHSNSTATSNPLCFFIGGWSYSIGVLRMPLGLTDCMHSHLQRHRERQPAQLLIKCAGLPQVTKSIRLSVPAPVGAVGVPRLHARQWFI